MTNNPKKTLYITTTLWYTKTRSDGRWNVSGSVVKRLRHRPFTAVTRVRFPSESLHERNMRHKKCATAYTGSVTTEYGDIAKW